jgi:hypothetical protein
VVVCFYIDGVHFACSLSFLRFYRCCIHLWRATNVSQRLMTVRLSFKHSSLCENPVQPAGRTILDLNAISLLRDKDSNCERCSGESESTCSLMYLFRL